MTDSAWMALVAVISLGGLSICWLCFHWISEAVRWRNMSEYQRNLKEEWYQEAQGLEAELAETRAARDDFHAMYNRLADKLAAEARIRSDRTRRGNITRAAQRKAAQAETTAALQAEVAAKREKPLDIAA